MCIQDGRWRQRILHATCEIYEVQLWTESRAETALLCYKHQALLFLGSSMLINVYVSIHFAIDGGGLYSECLFQCSLKRMLRV